jgi:group II intron reverse transcriptase/maturase
MIDYFETKEHPITRKMVLDAFREIKSNSQASGVDGVSVSNYAENLQANLYKLWNRLTSGSYFPQLVREKSIPKGNGKMRRLGIATVDDRIAQQVVRAYLEPKMEPTFHNDSYGFRKGRSAHQAIRNAMKRCSWHSWVIDLDISNYFDTIDHDLLLKALEKYTEERWVLMYISRWLKAGILQEDGKIKERHEGTIQGGVISPLLANMFLHFVFDKWMERYYPAIKFERYCDDIIVHCKSEKQAMFIKAMIVKRLSECKLSVNEQKSKVVFCKNPKNKGCVTAVSARFEFLGYAFKPTLTPTRDGVLLLTTPVMSNASQKKVMDKIRAMKLYRKKCKIQRLAKEINERMIGCIHYYCAFGKWATKKLWSQLNMVLIKWIMCNRGWGFKKALKWIKSCYKSQPLLFMHWAIQKP